MGSRRTPDKPPKSGLNQRVRYSTITVRLSKGESLASGGSFNLDSLNLNENFKFGSSVALATLQALGGHMGPAASAPGSGTREVPTGAETEWAMLMREHKSQVQIPTPPLADYGSRGSSQDAEGTPSSS